MKSSSEPSASLVWTWKGAQHSLPVSTSDMLTLARAMEYEDYPREGVAWALLQRAAWLASLGKPVQLGALVQSYAQPINPVWFPNGSKHVAEMERLRNKGDFTAAQAENIRAAQRPLKATTPWAELSDDTKSILQTILRGQSQTPVRGAVHYWASHGPDFATNQAAQPNFILLDRGYGFGKGRNVFFAVPGSESFGGVSVRHGEYAWPGANGIQVASLVSPQLVGAGLAILAGVLAWKWRHRS